MFLEIFGKIDLFEIFIGFHRTIGMWKPNVLL